MRRQLFWSAAGGLSAAALQQRRRTASLSGDRPAGRRFVGPDRGVVRAGHIFRGSGRGLGRRTRCWCRDPRFSGVAVADTGSGSSAGAESTRSGDSATSAGKARAVFGGAVCGCRGRYCGTGRCRGTDHWQVGCGDRRQSAGDVGTEVRGRLSDPSRLQGRMAVPSVSAGLQSAIGASVRAALGAGDGGPASVSAVFGVSSRRFWGCRLGCIE